MNGTLLRRRFLAGVAVAALALAGCGGGDDDSGSGGSTGGDDKYASLSGSLKASGASFPDAYYQEVISTRSRRSRPNLNITYNATGSGTGKKEFGAEPDRLRRHRQHGQGHRRPGRRLVPLRPDRGRADHRVVQPRAASTSSSSAPSTLAKIFQRDIKTWNDAGDRGRQPGRDPAGNKPITVVHRSDGSGTTNNFTKYLVAAAAGVWKLGSGDTVAVADRHPGRREEHRCGAS